MQGNTDKIHCIEHGLFVFIIIISSLSMLSYGKSREYNMEKKIITINEMNKDQLLAWNALFDLWLRDKFRHCIKALKYKQDCMQCGDIYFVVQFYINHEGHVSKYKIVREEIDCINKTVYQNNELRKMVTSDFENWRFPSSLNNMIIEVRMGQVTRC